MAEEKIVALANRIKLKRDSGEKYVLLLGAGASYSSGIALTPKMMKELVDTYGVPSESSVLDDRFDELWASATDADRRVYLEPYLKRDPSQGYLDLARLIEKGFFDTIVTFNFDALLEKGLERQGIPASDYKVIIRGEIEDGKIQQLLEAKEPRVKILKMHGSLYSTDYFLFSKEEMLNYPPEIEKLLAKITARDIIVCGYAFADLCVSRAFSPKGGALVCVNPSGPPTTLKGFIQARKSSPLVFSSDSGRFDDFFAALSEALLQPTKERQIVRNPFKFLESFAENEAGDYYGRRNDIRRTLEWLEGDRVRAIHIVGPPRVGKTSFVRAGILAQLDPNKFEKVYLRCQFDRVTRLDAELKRQAGIDLAGGDTEEVLGQLAASTDKRVVLVLDQFERVVSRFREDSQRQQLMKLLTEFHSVDADGLSVIFVGIDHRAYLLQLMELVKATSVEVQALPRFEARRVEAIIRLQAMRAGLSIDRRVIKDLGKKYNESKETDKPFTLAHIEAICHLLGNEERADWTTYRGIDNNHLKALDDAINQYDFVAFVADFPLPQERILLLEIMKRVSSESKWKIAEFLKDHCAELFLQESAAAASSAPPAGGPVNNTAEGGETRND